MWFWRIEFDGISPGKGPLGIDLFSDSVIGRDPNEGEIVDIDFGEYDAFDKGVSRRHALLRPTRNKLYVIDLDSTNGTRVNSLTIGQGRAMEVHSGDTLTLGKLSFTVKVILTPEQTAPDREAAAKEQSPAFSQEAQPFQKLPETSATARLSEETDGPKTTSAPSSPGDPPKDSAP
jgi:pSer/pThr/pTyr-binding forkhead associated (FHA) protein